MKRLLSCLLFAVLLASCSSPRPKTPTITPIPRKVIIYYTNDEHGWIEGQQSGQSAANLLGLWKKNANYTPNGDILLFSGGDSWTGTEISELFAGESVVEVMNAMGYDASALGNDEFAFGLEALKTRISQAKYPFLSGNIRKKDGSYPKDLGIKPFTVIQLEDIQVGVIGLTSPNSFSDSDPDHAVGFDFLDYTEALKQTVPQVRKEGADLIIVLVHDCVDKVKILAKQTADLGINLIGAAHCSELTAGSSDKTVFLSGGSSFASYAYAIFEVEAASGKVTVTKYGVNMNIDGPYDAEVGQIIVSWAPRRDSK